MLPVYGWGFLHHHRDDLPIRTKSMWRHVSDVLCRYSEHNYYFHCLVVCFCFFVFTKHVDCLKLVLACCICITVNTVNYIRFPKGATKVSGLQVKSCSSPAECIQGSVNFGISSTRITSQCCNSDLCNNNAAPGRLFFLSLFFFSICRYKVKVSFFMCVKCWVNSNVFHQRLSFFLQEAENVQPSIY